MPNKRFLTLVATLLSTAGATAAAAQDASSCRGPGAAFGVTSYRCASCGVRQSPGVRTQYVFEVEPVVLETTPASLLEPNDVVIAINRMPIMTQAGADAFAYPTAPNAVITVRRNGATVDVDARVLACRADAQGALLIPGGANGPMTIVDGVVVTGLGAIQHADIESIEVLKGAAASLLYGGNAAAGVIVITTKAGKAAGKRRPAGSDTLRAGGGPIYVVDGVVTNDPNASPLTAPATPERTASGRFGFALECPGQCTRGELVTAGESFRFETYPRVVELVPNGIADRAGLRVGDLVTHIDGKSILGRDGTRLITRGGQNGEMRVTVRRDRSEVSFTLVANP